MTATLDDEVADLRRVNAELQQKLGERTKERDEALQRETATADILRVINSSAGDAQPTLDAIAASATRLCGAASGAVFRFDGSLSHLAAHYNCSPAELDALRATYPLAPSWGSVTGRAILTRAVAYVADIATDPDYALPSIVQSGMHAHLSVPMLLDRDPVGAITVARREAMPFSEAQIELLRTFAAQAVIAMENARLLTETREALEQQTATAEVLQVINSSPGDLALVFDAMLEKALTLSGAAYGSLVTYDGEHFRAVALHAMPEPFADLLRQPFRPPAGGAQERLLAGERLIHIPDLADMEPVTPIQRAAIDAGVRTLLMVPLRKDHALLGYITAHRREVRPFSDKHIALLENFAAQAVIAMENARLLTETREALEQQTATAEVLQVINSSPGDLKPVFDAILEKALRLCEASFGMLWTYDGDAWEAVALRQVPPDYEAFLSGQHRPSPDTAHGRIARGERLVHIADVAAEELYRTGDPHRSRLVELAGARTFLVVPMRNEEKLVGAFSLYRQEVRPFTDQQVALLHNFAAQAVIAMENARLITETREALEQQTATAEVLQVINSSPGDLAPVFDSLLEKALRLCDAAFGLLIIWDGEQLHRAAFRGVPDELMAAMRQPLKPVPGGLADRLVRGERLIVIPDLLDPGDQLIGPGAQLLVRFGARSYIAIALHKDEALLGGIVIYRREVRPFSDKQIALLQNFAAQAVIAMENARLLTETRETLEQQTATAEVLQVINASPGDLVPVFDAILEKAHRLCGAAYGALALFNGEYFRAVAVRGYPENVAESVRQPFRGSGFHEKLIRGERYVHIPDVIAVASQLSGTPGQAMTAAGFRTTLMVPLRKDGKLLGHISASRLEVRPFSEKEIALLENFAAQAVIAMENARLLTETREALEQQTATAEVLQVINSSPGDITPVFDAILEKVLSLCEASFGGLQTFDGEKITTVATRGLPEQLRDSYREPRLPNPAGSFSRFLRGEQLVHIADITADSEDLSSLPNYKALANTGAARTALELPLRKERVLVGSMWFYRREIQPFTDKQIALLQNFAAQAVIAMENARLFTETREALEQQTATAEVLQVINKSPGNLTPVFDKVLERAVGLCEAAFGSMLLYDGGHFDTVAVRGVPAAFADYVKTDRPVHGPGTGPARILAGERVVHITDLAAEEPYRAGDPQRRALVDLGGARSLVCVPLLRDNAILGIIAVYRQEVRPFTDKQIALLQNFAAQAVIAMENARLLDEIRQRQQELRVTFDNMVDGVAMFDEALHLAAWNRNFQEMLQLPDELLAQRHDFDTYIRYLTERGEFGATDPETQIKRLRARIGDHYSFERTRPDGRVIEVRNNPMPDGGIVVIYSDITERKRSEAEIRAARDAAEAAYRDLKAAQASLIQAEKMASLGQLTAGIAHEIKNPLNFVNNFADLSVELLDELKQTAAPAITALDDEKRTEIDETIGMLTGNLEKIAEHGRRADGIVKSMLEHSRGSSSERRSVDLNGLIDEALNLAYHGGRAQDQSFNITLERDYTAATAPIEIVPQDITRVCLNLFGNGFYAATKRQREGGDSNFKPTLRVSTRDLGDVVEVRIRDNGVGIPPEIKDKLFQPFFTTKPTGEGTGLGLSISYDIVTQEHGGTITVDSRVGEFTEFTFRLPRTHQTTIAEAAS